MYELMVEGTFDAAHQLVGYEGPCENLHGHTWKAQVFLSGAKLNKTGMLMDFKQIKAELHFILSKLDHTNLNIVPYFKKTNPTSENVAKYIFDEFSNRIGKNRTVAKVTVFESPITSASYIR
jgi:6-pyruvoyltetrahydropterin/6-carboxytetrahydropterin synthase